MSAGDTLAGVKGQIVKCMIRDDCEWLWQIERNTDCVLTSLLNRAYGLISATISPIMVKLYTAASAKKRVLDVMSSYHENG